MPLDELATLLAHDGEAIGLIPHRFDRLDQGLRVLRRREDTRAGTLEDSARLAVHGGQDGPARSHELEDLGRDDGIEEREIAQQDKAEIGGRVDLRHAVARLLVPEGDVLDLLGRRSFLELRLLRALAHEEEADPVGLDALGDVEDEIEAVRHAVGADVGDEEARRQPQGGAGFVARARLEEIEVDAVGDDGHALGRDAVRADLLHERVGHRNDVVRVLVEEVLDLLEVLDDEAVLLHRPASTMLRGQRSAPRTNGTRFRKERKRRRPGEVHQVDEGVSRPGGEPGRRGRGERTRLKAASPSCQRCSRDASATMPYRPLHTLPGSPRGPCG